MSTLKNLLGQYLDSVEFERFLSLGFKSVALTLRSGAFFKIKAFEIPLGRYETYGLMVDNGHMSSDESMQIGRRVNGVFLFEREEWLVSTDKAPGLVGNDPLQLEYGPVGTSPKDIAEIARPLCGIRLTFVDSVAAVLISVDQYPGLISFAYPDRRDDKFYETSSLLASFTMRG